MTPLVSVIIPTYNHARYLREALESLLVQSYPNWEALVVNNHSEDDTLEVIASFKDTRISVENFRNNGVIGASRNVGIRLSRGKYVAFLDSDDKWYPDKLSRCVEHLEQGADLVCHWLRSVGDREGFVKCGPSKRATFDSLLDRGSCIVTSATVVRRSGLLSVGCFSENATFNTSEDYHLWLKLAKANKAMVFIEDVLGEYRVHSANSSNAAISHMHSALGVVGEFLPDCPSMSFKSRLRVRRCKAGIYYGAGRSFHAAGSHRDGLRLLLTSLSQWPLQLKTWAAVGISSIALIRSISCHVQR
jgi:hypothetical protein